MLISHINIEILDGGKVHNNHMLIGEIAFLRGRELAIDLIVIDMLYFDVILDMDFLRKSRVKIDYQKKKIWFNFDNYEELTFGKG